MTEPKNEMFVDPDLVAAYDLEVEGEEKDALQAELDRHARLQKIPTVFIELVGDETVLMIDPGFFDRIGRGLQMMQCANDSAERDAVKFITPCHPEMIGAKTDSKNSPNYWDARIAMLTMKLRAFELAAEGIEHAFSEAKAAIRVEVDLMKDKQGKLMYSNDTKRAEAYLEFYGEIPGWNRASAELMSIRIATQAVKDNLVYLQKCRHDAILSYERETALMAKNVGAKMPGGR